MMFIFNDEVGFFSHFASGSALHTLLFCYFSVLCLMPLSDASCDLHFKGTFIVEDVIKFHCRPFILTDDGGGDDESQHYLHYV